MQTRVVYTVTREAEDTNESDFKNTMRALSDEPGEYLYGGAIREIITVQGQVSTDNGKTWKNFYPNLDPSFE